MCDWYSAAAAAVQVGGTYLSNKSSSRQANTSANLDEQQAAVLRDNAEAEASRIRRAGDVQRGETLGAIAASGVKIGEGSALEAERQVLADYETDAAIAILSGKRQSDALKYQAKLTRASGKDATNAGWLNAAGSMLQMGASSWQQSGWKGG